MTDKRVGARLVELAVFNCPWRAERPGGRPGEKTRYARVMQM